MQEDLILGDTGLPVARELAELELVKRDLGQSRASLSMWVKRYRPEGEKDENERTINGSLFRDGITQFVGCFDSKNAYPLVVESVYPKVEGIAAYFHWLRNLRNSYTAHRHGAARQCVVGAVVQPGTGKFLGHSKLIAIYAGPNREGHSALLTIVDMAIQHVENRLEQLTQQFISEVSALPQEELLKLRPAVVQAQEPSDMGKSRGDVRKKIEREDAASFAQPPQIKINPA